MRRAVSYCIKKALASGQSVYLENIGTLSLNKTKNKRTKKSRILKLRKDQKSSNKGLIRIIQDNYRLKEKSAKDVLKRFQELTIKKLEKDGIVTIPNVVIISKSKGRKTTISSLLSPQKIKSSTKQKSVSKKKEKKQSKVSNLEAVAVSATSKFSEQESTEVSSDQPKSATINVNDQHIEDDLLEEISLLEQSHQTAPQADDLKEKLKEHFYQEDIIDEVILEDSDQSEQVNEIQKPQPIQSRSFNSNSTNFKPWIIGFLSLIGFILMVYLGSKFFLNKSDSHPVSSPEIGMSQEVDNDRFKKDLKEEFPLQDVALISEPTGSAQKCIIITGSFSEDYNQQRMENTILEFGYDLYVEEYGKLNRVGIITSCTESNIQSKLNTIRSEIESTAWVLSPEEFVL